MDSNVFHVQAVRFGQVDTVDPAWKEDHLSYDEIEGARVEFMRRASFPPWASPETGVRACRRGGRAHLKRERHQVGTAGRCVRRGRRHGLRKHSVM